MNNIKEFVNNFISNHNYKLWNYRIKLIKDNLSDIITHTDFLDLNSSLSSRFYCILNDIKEYPKCYCGKNVNYSRGLNGFYKYCSNICNVKSTETIRKINKNKYDNIDSDGLNTFQRSVKKSINTLKYSFTKDSISKFQDRVNKTTKTKKNIDPETGLTYFQISARKACKTLQSEIDENGINKKQKISRKSVSERINKIDPITGLNPFQISSIKSIKTRLTVDPITGLNGFDRGRKTKESHGLLVPLSQLSELKKYRLLVSRITNKNYKKYINIINPYNLPRRSLTNKQLFHVDHIYSIMEGFKNNIPVEIISHPCNLRVIWYTYNISKSNKCDITLNELYLKIKEWEKNNGNY